MKLKNLKALLIASSVLATSIPTIASAGADSGFYIGGGAGEADIGETDTAYKAFGGFNFGVIDINENAFLAKFDKCVWHESMKQVDDQELAYYAVCYPGPRLRRHADYNVWLRRSVTLFSGEFCDELRWDRHVHDEPEQPSNEFSRRIVPK